MGKIRETGETRRGINTGSNTEKMEHEGVGTLLNNAHTLSLDVTGMIVKRLSTDVVCTQKRMDFDRYTTVLVGPPHGPLGTLKKHKEISTVFLYSY